MMSWMDPRVEYYIYRNNRNVDIDINRWSISQTRDVTCLKETNLFESTVLHGYTVHAIAISSKSTLVFLGSKYFP
jgi:hypothetical protein